MAFSPPTICPRFFYGVRTDVVGNAFFGLQQDIIYPAGCVVVVHDHLQRKQRYIRIPEKSTLKQMAISPNRKILALYETGEKHVVTLWDLEILKKKKTLIWPTEAVNRNVKHMCFSYDSKYITVLTGEPDFMIWNFFIEKGKIDSSVKGGNINNVGSVKLMAPNPNDNTVLAIGGNSIFRLLALAEGLWRPWGFGKGEQMIITGVQWITQDAVMFGTSTGVLWIIENGELRNTYKATVPTIMDIRVKESYVQSLTDVHAAEEEEEALSEESRGDDDAIGGGDAADANLRSYIMTAVTCIIAFPRGFAFVIYDTAHVFEKDTPTKFRKRNVIQVDDPNMGHIQHLAINAAQDTLICTTKKNQLYSAKIWGPDKPQVHEGLFKPMGEPLHDGLICSLSVCAWKPIFMTCGATDKTVKVWNYETGVVEMSKQYMVDVFSVALHPTGLFALVGCSDKLRYTSVLIDDLRPVREISIRNCRDAVFSNCGHMFVAANGNILQIYSTISFDLMFTLKGHNGKIRSLAWSQTDVVMCSAGSEGAMYFWSMSTGERLGEMILKTTSFNGLGVSSNGETAYTVSADGFIREISNSMLMRSVRVMSPAFVGLPPNQQPKPHSLDCMTMARTDLMAFASGNNGTVLSLKFPLQEAGGGLCMEYRLHFASVTKMRLSYDDLTLITVSEDGSVAIWRVGNYEGRNSKMDKEFSFCKDILMPKAEMEEKMSFIKGLEKRMKEIENEHAYQMRQGAVTFQDQMREIHAGYCEAIEELKEKNEQLELDHVQEMNTINADIAKTKMEHDRMIQEMESKFNEKLIIEYDKYAKFEDRNAEMRGEYEQKLKDLHALMISRLDDTANNYKAQLKEKIVMIDEMNVESRQRDREYEESHLQIEDDADRELLEIRTSYETQLKEERDLGIKLRGEVGVMRKKFQNAQKELDAVNMQVHTLQSEQQKLQQAIISLERDIADLKKEIIERDGTIQDKEKRIGELKRKNQELEKYKFVLNYKIKELKNQIEPKEREIKEKKDQIALMEIELEGLQKVNGTMEIRLDELHEKLNSAQMELQRERAKVRTTKTVLHNIRNDLHTASGIIQQPTKLKAAVKTLFHKYNDDSESAKARQQEADVHVEFMNQRQHMEKLISNLQRRLDQGGAKAGQEVVQVMEENVELIQEINALRQELKNKQNRMSDMEAILGISGKFLAPKEAREKLERAVANREKVDEECEEKINNLNKTIDILKEENSRLAAKLSEEPYTGDEEEITDE